VFLTGSVEQAVRDAGAEDVQIEQKHGKNAEGASPGEGCKGREQSAVEGENKDKTDCPCEQGIGTESACKGGKREVGEREQNNAQQE